MVKSVMSEAKVSTRVNLHITYVLGRCMVRDYGQVSDVGGEGIDES